MNVRNLILGTMLPVFISGCHQSPRNNAYVELMGAQRRALEDRIYDLEFEYEEVTTKLATLQRENQRLRQQLEGSSDSSTPSFEVNPGRSDRGNQDDEKSPDGVPHIKIDPGTPTDKPPNESLGKTDEDLDFNLRPDTDTLHSQIRSDASSAQISHIVLNPEDTGMVSFDEQNNNDGVIVSLQPRDRDDQFVRQPGAITIVVLDPTQTGHNARVARWEISQSDVDQILNASADVSSITMELEWPEAPPKNTELVLFVRYQTADGRKYETHARIKRTPTGTISNRSNSPDVLNNSTSPHTGPDHPGVPADHTSFTPPSKLHIPRTARSATSQPAAANTQSPQWRPYR